MEVPPNSPFNAPCIQASCKICGADASGHHYEVISCIACKSFFRRAAGLGRSYQCKREGKCTDNLRRCKSCRFQKCLDVGMNPLAFEPQNPDEAKNVETLAIRTASAHRSLSTPEEHIRGIIANLKHTNEALEKLRLSVFDPHPLTECNEPLVFDGPSKLGFHYEHLPACSSQVLVADLETMKRFLALLYHTKFGGAPGSVKHWTSTGIVCAVEMIKTLPAVEGMASQEKRRFFFSSSLACSHFTDAYFSYRQGSTYTVYPDGTMPYAADPPYTLAAEFHTAVIERMKSIDLALEEFLLARAILCFSTTATGVRRFEQQREYFTRMFCSYVMASRGTSKAPSAILEILSLISCVLSLTRKMKNYQLLLNLTRRQGMKSLLIQGVLAS